MNKDAVSPTQHRHYRSAEPLPLEARFSTSLWTLRPLIPCLVELLSCEFHRFVLILAVVGAIFT